MAVVTVTIPLKYKSVFRVTPLPIVVIKVEARDRAIWQSALCAARHKSADGDNKILVVNDS